MHRLLPLLLLLTAAAPPQRPVVIELFTSQGCSDCPPADTLLTELAATRPDILPLAFHVTYWNNLGWRDPFSLDAATDRQKAYTPLSTQGGPYTPEAIIDGRYDAIGSDRPAILAALTRAAATQTTIPLTLTQDATTLTITLPAGTGPATLWLIGYDSSHRTPVGRGENAGHTLVESNIVRSLKNLATWQGAPLTLHAPLPPGEHVAILLQSKNGQILGAQRL